MASSAGTTNTQDAEESKSLPTLFKQGLHLFNNLGKQDEPTNSPAVQMNISRCMRIFEDATRLVSLASIFSTNETVDEIPTSDLQYLLLPALLGSLCLKMTTRDRTDIVNVANVYYRDFLRRCKEYGLTTYSPSEENKEEDAAEAAKPSQQSQIDVLRSMTQNRAQKIQRFHERKELEAKLTSLKKVMENENVDEEVKRDYYITLIKSFISEAIEDMAMIEMEKGIITQMGSLTPAERNKPKRPPPPLKPMIITKDAVQKAVFGAGYPSLPVMSVDEFYEKRVSEGIFPDPHKAQAGPMSLQQRALAGIEQDDDEEKAEEDAKVDADDPALLQKLRDQDEYKDDHRRGWGNRANRS